MFFEKKSFIFWRNFISILLVLAYIQAFFHRTILALLTNEIMASFHLTGAQIGLLSGVYFYVYLIMQIPSGILADKLGARYTVGFGMLCAALGAFIFGLSPNFMLAVFGRFLVGLGVSVCFVGMMKHNTLWFESHRYAFVSGLFLFISNNISLISNILLKKILIYIEWRSAFLLVSFGSLILGFLILHYVRNDPTELGFSPVVVPPKTEMAHQPWYMELKQVLQIGALWPPFLLLLGITGGTFAFIGLWAQKMAREGFAISENQALLHFVCLSFGLGLGSLLIGSLSDYLKKRNIVRYFAGGMVLFWAYLCFVPWQPNETHLILFFCMGLCGATGGPVYATSKELAPPHLAGMAMGFANLGVFLSASIIQPLLGYLLDKNWHGAMENGARIYAPQAYQQGLILFFGFALMAFIASLFMRETYCKNQFFARNI